jgi:hypothetical protein
MCFPVFPIITSSSLIPNPVSLFGLLCCPSVRLMSKLILTWRGYLHLTQPPTWRDSVFYPGFLHLDGLPSPRLWSTIYPHITLWSEPLPVTTHRASGTWGLQRAEATIPWGGKSKFIPPWYPNMFYRKDKTFWVRGTWRKNSRSSVEKETRALNREFQMLRHGEMWLTLSFWHFSPWRWGGSSTQAWMPTYVSILRIAQMMWVWRATVEWYFDKGKWKNSEKNPSQCHFVHPKSHMVWPGAKPGLRGERPATNNLSYGTVLWHVTFK